MRKKKKLVIGAIAMSIVGAMVGKTAVYQCLPCGLGTYSDGTLTSCASCPAGTYSHAGAGSCTKCPAGYYSNAGAGSCIECQAGTYASAGSSSCSTCPDDKVCPGGTGTYLDPSRCNRLLVNTLNSSGLGFRDTSKYIDLDTGIYQFEVAGAGGGGAGGSCWQNCGFMKQQDCWHCGGKGGAGDLVNSKIIHITTPTQMQYLAGTGGAGGSGNGKTGHEGSVGYTSYIKISSIGYTLSAAAGDGADDHTYGGSDKKDIGNGQGGAGGSGGCRREDGGQGGNGWIKVYKYYDCK